MILILDNYDSFTYNLVQYIGELNSNIVVKKNDQISTEEINKLCCSHIIISPGPYGPLDAGESMNVVKRFYKKVPILGVCLGHQAIGYSFGCKIKKCIDIFHGKVSMIEHNKKSKIFQNIPKYFDATRYHSLIIDKSSISDDLIVNAWLDDGTIMGIEHKKFPIYGVQFHPESIETKYGKRIIENFLNIV